VGRLPLMVGILAIVALALFLAPNPYWTFSLEAFGWAGLAYVSFEATPKGEQATAMTIPSDSSTNSGDVSSQATVSAEAEDAFEDVLFELKARLRNGSVQQLLQIHLPAVT
jgi:hypothetical protein